jgi:hypothetical protein
MTFPLNDNTQTHAVLSILPAWDLANIPPLQPEQLKRATMTNPVIQAAGLEP